MEPSKRQKLERAFYNFEKNKEKAGAKAIDVAWSGMGTDYSKVPVQKSASNVSESKVIKYVDEKEEASKWVKVVENTIIKYKDEYKYKLIIYLYIKRYSINKIISMLNIDRATLFRWKSEILLTAEFWAKELSVKL